MSDADLVKTLHCCADTIKRDTGICDRSKCPAAKSPGRGLFPYCCADVWDEAADRLESLSERVAIMMEGKEDGDGTFDYGDNRKG